MKRILTSIIFVIAFCSSAFAYDKNLTAALGINVDIHTDPEIRQNVFPLLPGVFVSYDSFNPGQTIGFHFDSTFFGFVSKIDEDSSNGFAVTFTSSIGPSLRIGKNSLLLLSPSISAGIKLADLWAINSSRRNHKLYGSSLFFFECFLGFGGDVILAFGQTICFGANFYYYPLCFTYMNSDERIKKCPQGAMYRAGLFVGVMVDI